MNGTSYHNNGDIVRYLDTNQSIFQKIRKDLQEVNFRCERGLFAEAGTPATESGRKLHTSGALVWRMAHRRTGGRRGKHSEETDNFASFVFGDSRKPPEYRRIFSRTASKKSLRLYADYEQGVKQRNKENTVKRHVLSMSELLKNRIRACLSRTLFDGSDLEEANLREAIARYA